MDGMTCSLSLFDLTNGMVLHFVWFKKMTTLHVNTNTKFVKKNEACGAERYSNESSVPSCIIKEELNERQKKKEELNKTHNFLC